MNQNEQLVIDFNTIEPPISAKEKDNNSKREYEEYDHLDTQLAKLMLQLQGNNNPKINIALKASTLEISKHTREGQIAISCNAKQQESLAKTSVVGSVDDYKPLILDQGYLYLRRYWQYQQRLADQINARINQTTNFSLDEEMTARLEHYFPSDQSSEEEINWQKVAAEQALKKVFLIISGGPGTGKTTTISRILALLIAIYLHKNAEKKAGGLSYNILLAAPTGKAAIRMLDAIQEEQESLNLPKELLQYMPKEASTIHKLLGYIPEKVNFKHNSDNPLNADVVLVDEASMIDIALMSKLVEAVPAHAKLILIGDKNQLSSVETGSVFSDICYGLSSNKQTKSNIITLQKNWRFSDNSSIGQLASATHQGNANAVIEILEDKQQSDCHLYSPEIIKGFQINNDLIKPWAHYFEVLLNPKASIQSIFDAFQEYRILCALRRGSNGSVSLNQRIQSQVFNDGFMRADEEHLWYHGRPVMVTQNDYNKGLFNGDTGIALLRNGKMQVWFPTTEASESQVDPAFKAYSPIRLPAYETTWVMTIHKSQGSEFDNISLILPHEEMPLLTRQLIYTGITRAKKRLNIIADHQVLRAGIKTNAVTATQIADKLVRGS